MFQVLSDLTDTHERVKMVVELMALEVEPDKSKRILANSTTVGERLELLKSVLSPPAPEPEPASEISQEPEPSVEIVLEPSSPSFGRRIKEIALALLLD
jgi:hypothetical protein